MNILTAKEKREIKNICKAIFNDKDFSKNQFQIYAREKAKILVAEKNFEDKIYNYILTEMEITKEEG